MLCDKLTPIDLECNMGKDSVTGLVNRELWKAYDIDEVDAAIAELKESHKMEVEQLLMEIAELQKQVHDYAQGLYVIQARADKDARHHKYKRCLAMVRMLEYMFCPVTDCKENWRVKWRKRWLELAEKFKEAK